MLKELLLKPYLADFKTIAIQAAVKKREPFDWADTKLDEIESKYPQYVGTIYELANRDDWCEKIFGSDAVVLRHHDWLKQMRDGILLRWLVDDAKKAYATKPPTEPETFAAQFLDKASVSLHDTIWNETDPEAWAQIFVLAELDTVWVEKLRVAFEKELNPEAEDQGPEAKDQGAKDPAPKAKRQKKA